jgi:hypothetical protein
MANSDFPLVIGARNGSNGAAMRALKTGRVPHAFAGPFWWYQKFDISLAGTLDGDGVQEFDLHTYNANNLFPANVIRGVPMIYLSEVFAGGTVNACTVDVFTGATLGYLANTVSAAEYAPRLEASFIPTITIRTTAGNISALTTGELWVGIKFAPVAGVS